MGLGRHAVMWAVSSSPFRPRWFSTAVFHPRNAVVFFTVLTLGAGWRYVQARCNFRTGRGDRWEVREVLETEESHRHDHPSPSIPLSVEGRGRRDTLTGNANRSSPWWAVLTGAGVGLMFATKETFVLTLLAMGLAGVVIAWWTLPKGNRVQNLRALWNWKHAALALCAAGIIWLLLFSSFFTNFSGPLDSVRTYFPWLKRAGGDSPHIHPWNFYLQRLAWFHLIKGPRWSEGLILLLAGIGAIVSLAGKRSPLLRFLALYTIILTAIYSAISYKTPWCLLSFFTG
jgi:4-amino-4-deoxy-L-arabinose transferase-like glycosyltransferase